MADLLRLSAGVVLSRGGVVRGFTNLGERLLPHRIRSRQVWHSEGKYWMMHFDCNPATMAELRQTLKLDPRICCYQELSIVLPIPVYLRPCELGPNDGRDSRPTSVDIDEGGGATSASTSTTRAAAASASAAASAVPFGPPPMLPPHTASPAARLDYYFRFVQAIILARQNAVTGLIPASVAVTAHGDYRDAWVRDNVYSILAVYGLAIAYRRMDDDNGRAYELEQSVIKLMRGLLMCMMRQSHKVEKFKHTQSLRDALHAKYNTATTDTVVDDRSWGHLQIDATSIFILMLAQFTASGMRIVFTQDEVDFVQNLVYYIERAYRTPEFGLWERGNKSNHGEPELNSSSIGMAVAAMRAINNINLFGPHGGPASVIHVLQDEIARNVSTLSSALPRESYSKETDAALLSVIGYPAFAINDVNLRSRTRNEVINKLAGNYGCKRFLRDGHQCVIEDRTRMWYHPKELKAFEHIECEWPLFFTYLILDGIFGGDPAMVATYRDKLQPLLVDSMSMPDLDRFIPHDVNEQRRQSISTPLGSSAPQSPIIARDHFYLVPELYYVPMEFVDAERANPQTQARLPNDNVPLVWANSLYILGCLLQEQLVTTAEIDPLNLRVNAGKSEARRNVIVQLVLLAEDERLQARLATFGLETQTLAQVAPVQVCPPSALVEVYKTLGANSKLGLTGRPARSMGTLSTCRLYRVQGRLYAFTPHFMNREEYYLSSDNDYLIFLFENELAFINKNHSDTGRPTMTIMLTNDMFADLPNLSARSTSARSTSVGTPGVGVGVGAGAGAGGESYTVQQDRLQSSRHRNLLTLMMNLRSGSLNGVRVRLGRMQEFVTTSYVQSLDFLVLKNEINWQSVLQAATTKRKHRKTEFTLRQDRDLESALTAGHHPVHSPSYFQSHGLDSAPTPPRPGSRHGYPASGHMSRRHSFINFNALSTALVAPLGDGPKSESRRAGLSSVGSTTSMLSALEELTLQSFRLKEHARTGQSQQQGQQQHQQQHLMESDQNAYGTGYDGIPEQLSLVLRDPQSTDAAIAALSASSNLFDQADLLHYLHSCHGLDYQIVDPVTGGAASIRTLVSQVYSRAIEHRLWSVVRQTAGILRKVVSSLAINVTDLNLIQKVLTVGHGPEDETQIDRPLQPDALSELIYRNCDDEVREGPLIQEMIHILGALARANRSVLDGISRLRIHNLIIAMREEIGRVRAVDEIGALDILMSLSPFEIKSLLTTVLSGPLLSSVNTSWFASGFYGLQHGDTINEDTDGYNLDNDNGTGGTIEGKHHQSANLINKQLQQQPVRTVSVRDHSPDLSPQATPVVKPQRPIPRSSADNGAITLTITAKSAGYSTGSPAARIEINSIAAPVCNRGLNVVFIDPIEQIVMDVISFDTCFSHEQSELFARYVEMADSGTIVVVAAMDDCAERLGDSARAACATLGSQHVSNVGYRDSWCFIGQKGAQVGSAVESHVPAHLNTGTDTISRTFNLSALARQAMGIFDDEESASLDAEQQLQQTAMLSSTRTPRCLLGSSLGRWLRRRKNDGAVGRVPPHFYTKVWSVLEIQTTTGIKVGSYLLDRDVIYEKTPEELNFAVLSEAAADNIVNPAVRSLIQEMTQVIEFLGRWVAQNDDDSNGYLGLDNEGEVNVLDLVEMAIKEFWDDCAISATTGQRDGQPDCRSSCRWQFCSSSQSRTLR
ncbi:phosphorylase kinase alphabeta [Ramicandelaber brevisporus]|nr:phosphorylase kinase alphabeta [Ramicandelaber brevisporus]